jgi:hypothetical protein
MSEQMPTWASNLLNTREVARARAAARKKYLKEVATLTFAIGAGSFIGFAFFFLVFLA